MEAISIESEYITLGQFLKLICLISSGGQAKYFLVENEVLVNNERDERRGRKLYENDVILVLGNEYKIVCT
ncbi:ribosome-associated protein [Bacilli bacterium PM5-9]|nr:ribosome-associated protein [Bacilli bacterium PM5-9]